MEKEKKPLSDTVREMLQLFVDSDQKIYGAISDATLQALQVQGYVLQQGVVVKNQGKPLLTLRPVPIERRMMILDMKAHSFNMQEIENRRFMYNPKSGVLILGYQYEKTNSLLGSHADDLAMAGIKQNFDDFVRGWVGTGRQYPHGVIHFAPNIDSRNVSLFEKGFDTLEMFSANGAQDKTVVRAFGKHWEQPLSSILHPASEREKRASLRQQLKENAPPKNIPKKKEKQQPER